MNTKNNTIKILAAALTVAVASMTSPTAFGTVEDVGVPTREDAVLVSMVAEVAAIDYETREVTLKDELGKEISIVAGPEVERLGEIAVGDSVEADYYLSLAFELREPTADEIANPLQGAEDAARNEADQAPGAGALRMIKAVCTIEGLDRPTETVTLMGPLGGLNVIQVRDVSYLPKLKIGQSVVVTYTEALAIGLVKVELPAAVE
jgi:Cu/Ag efflux protein CusF